MSFLVPFFHGFFFAIKSCDWPWSIHPAHIPSQSLFHFISFGLFCGGGSSSILDPPGSNSSSEYLSHSEPIPTHSHSYSKTRPLPHLYLGLYRSYRPYCWYWARCHWYETALYWGLYWGAGSVQASVFICATDASLAFLWCASRRLDAMLSSRINRLYSWPDRGKCATIRDFCGAAWRWP